MSVYGYFGCLTKIREYQFGQEAVYKYGHAVRVGFSGSAFWIIRKQA
jgi:hypothetical protein